MKDKKPLVSVVVTNYNKGDWIKDALDSFLMQKANFEFEVIAIDDKSTDHSVDIIRRYAKRYPAKIRAFYNEKNLGITKTWIKACKKVRGKYIARCDGDDYWIDENKLQKQVDALEKSKKSQWCCTDYNIIDRSGSLIQEGAVGSGYIKRPENYAEMLAKKGFTMASTWLVGTSLMLEVNNEVNPSAVDDTFNIQLDLFNKTNLIYIPDVTTVYRIGYESDSRPVNQKDTQRRNKKLLDTQKEYLKKYRNKNYLEIIEYLLNDSLALDDRLELVKEQGVLIEKQKETIKKLDLEIRALRESKRYKLGEFLLKPFSKLKKIMTNGSDNKNDY